MSDSPRLRIAPPEFCSDPAIAALFAILPEARLVGGAVRDVLAGRPPADLDMASPLPPDEVVARLKAAGVKSVPTGLAHGTVTAVLPGRTVEITTLRRDVETDGRHAVVAFTDDWREDAARRDFTVNAMSMTPGGSVFDYFGGLEDLRAGRLRFVGEPAARIAEDYLRVFRFFRFFARYATLPPDEATLAALRGAVPHLGGLSVERIWNEVFRILAAPDPRRALALMDELGVLAVAVPEGTDLAALSRTIDAGAPPDPVLRMAALLAGDKLAFSKRLKLSLLDRDRLIAFRAAPLAKPGDGDVVLRRLLAETPAEVLIGRTWLAGAGGRAWDELRRRLRAMTPPVFPLEGRDILALGSPPGPRVGAVLRSARAWWMADGCQADATACLAAARRAIDAG